jgi:hypothetical protein
MRSIVAPAAEHVDLRQAVEQIPSVVARLNGGLARNVAYFV